MKKHSEIYYERKNARAAWWRENGWKFVFYPGALFGGLIVLYVLVSLAALLVLEIPEIRSEIKRIVGSLPQTTEVVKRYEVQHYCNCKKDETWKVVFPGDTTNSSSRIFFTNYAFPDTYITNRYLGK